MGDDVSLGDKVLAYGTGPRKKYSQEEYKSMVPLYREALDNRLSVPQICTELALTHGRYVQLRDLTIKNSWIEKELLDSYHESRKVSHSILTEDERKQYALELIEGKLTAADLRKTLSINKNVSRKILLYAVSRGWITVEQRATYISNSGNRSVKARREKYTKEQLLEMSRNAGIKSAITNVGKHKNYGHIGGKMTQQDHAEKMEKNRKGAAMYGQTKCTYEGQDYDSRGERLMAVLLQESGFLENIVKGVSFQRSIDRIVVDFYIENPVVSKKPVIIEYHPIPKQKNLFDDSIEDAPKDLESYIKKRKERLKGHTNAKLIVVSPANGRLRFTDFYHMLMDMRFNDDDQVKKLAFETFTRANCLIEKEDRRLAEEARQRYLSELEDGDGLVTIDDVPF